MKYQNNEQALVQLLQKLEYVQGTFPPVYMINGVLISYDKLERIRIIAEQTKNTESEENIKSLSGQMPDQLAE